METGMIVIAAVLTATVAVPTYLSLQSTKKQSKTLYNGLKASVSKENGVLSHHVEQKNFALGIDSTNNKFFFYKRTGDQEVSKTIDRTTVKTCEIVKTTRRVKDKKSSREVIELIALSFNNSVKSEHIELYNENESFMVQGELEIAEEWKKIINSTIANKEVPVENTQRKLVKVGLS